jgi:hypothetical protein
MVVIQQRDWFRKEKKHYIRVRTIRSALHTFCVCFMKGLKIVVMKQPWHRAEWHIRRKRTFYNTVQINLLMIMCKIVNNIKSIYLPRTLCSFSDCSCGKSNFCMQSMTVDLDEAWMVKCGIFVSVTVCCFEVTTFVHLWTIYVYLMCLNFFHSHCLSPLLLIVTYFFWVCNIHSCWSLHKLP